MPANRPRKNLSSSDLRGVAKLATQATSSVTRIVEGVHQSVWDTLGLAGGDKPGQTGGLTGLIYQTIQDATQLLGKGADKVLAGLEPLFESLQESTPESPRREAVLAALNGVMGDRLVAGDNPFATPMSLRYQGQALDLPGQQSISRDQGKVLLFIHGLCLNDLQWRGGQQAGTSDHAQALLSKLGYTPIYLRYNSGLHISQNGGELAAQLERLVAHWPTPINELTVVAHSMGGLLIRSAVHQAMQASLHWPDRLQNIVFLGTPHHGAPLAKAGHWLDAILGGNSYTAPFTRLAQLRSAGITDLRHGNVQAEDWQSSDRFELNPDQRLPLPLPIGVNCHTLAATTASKRSPLSDRLVGDQLVPLHSALGQHADAQHCLAFAATSRKIIYRTNHMELLGSPQVTQQLLQWLG
jgi:pimeloyl-ACP methyl ester carboxylesterase